MLIDRGIGYDPDEGMGIDGASFQRELLELDGMGFKTIKVYINSPGGAVMDGYNIFNAILKTKTPVDTYNMGIAASIAGVIFMAGRKRIMADYAQFMMHNPFGGTDKKQLDAMKGSLCTMLAARSSIKETDVAYMMDRTTWMGPAECLEKGFCTDIEATNDHNRKYMPATTAQAMWNASNKILNSAFNLSNMENTISKANGLSLIANYLGLNVDATENSVLQELKAKVNAGILAKEKSEEELDKMKKKLDKMQADFEDMKEKYDKACKDAKDTKDKAEKDKKEAEDKIKEEQDKAKKVEAKVMVEAYVKIGKIKAESVDKWVAKAVLDLVGTKELLEEIPLNKTAPVIAVGSKQKEDKTEDALVDPNEVPANAMGYMARVMANVNNRQKAS
jgi:ATP-dependent protease ClpP protease subunit